MRSLKEVFGRSGFWIFVRLSIAGCYLPILACSLFSQDTPANTHVRSEIRHIGTAEARSISSLDGAYPKLHPEVYWHDQDWNIDVLPEPNAEDAVMVDIASNSGTAKIVTFPNYFAQIDSISRAPGDKAIMIAEANGTASAFLITDLRTGTLVDEIGMYSPSISPDGRFILYINGYPTHGVGGATQYRLYDTLKTPRENTCAYMASDPEHKELIEDLRGFQVYPRIAVNSPCISPGNPNNENHSLASDFAWTTDSGKVVFADVKDGVMSLVLVTMPVGVEDQPKTSVYALKSSQDVCAGATAANGAQNCDYHVIQSLAWDGDSVEAVFHHHFGTPLNLRLTIPVSSFVAIGK